MTSAAVPRIRRQRGLVDLGGRRADDDRKAENIAVAANPDGRAAVLYGRPLAMMPTAPHGSVVRTVIRYFAGPKLRSARR